LARSAMPTPGSCAHWDPTRALTAWNQAERSAAISIGWTRSARCQRPWFTI
jgi:hypothetical protein